MLRRRSRGFCRFGCAIHGFAPGRDDHVLLLNIAGEANHSG